METLKRLKIAGLCLIAVAALFAVSVASASAATQPEYKDCVKASKNAEKKYTGNYNDKACTEVSGTKSGKYELVEVAPGTKFAGKGKTMTLPAESIHSAVESIECKKTVVAGEITGASSVTATVKYEKCEANKEKGDLCGNVATSTIESTINAELYWLDSGGTVPGVLSQPPVLNFKCGTEPVEITGNLIGAIGNGKKGPTFVYAGSGGKQAHDAFFVEGEEFAPFFVGYEIEGHVAEPHEAVFTNTIETAPALKGVTIR